MCVRVLDTKCIHTSAVYRVAYTTYLAHVCCNLCMHVEYLKHSHVEYVKHSHVEYLKHSHTFITDLVLDIRVL